MMNKQRATGSTSVKKILVGSVVLVAAIVGMVVLSGQQKGKLVAAVEPFFAKLGAGDLAAAYEMTSPMFKQSTSLTAFTTLVERNGLDKYQSARWTLGHTAAADQKALEGWISTTDGRTVHVTVTMGALTGELRIVNLMDLRQGD